jgi:hypothetical protein
MRRHRVKRTRQGTYKIDLPAEERRVVRSLLDQLRQLLSEDIPDERLRRLFPTAYATDEEADREYQRLMRDELVASRLASIESVSETLDANVLQEQELHAWMASVNAIRLVLGTLLDITEDHDLGNVSPDDEDIETYVLYSYLSALLDEMVTALAS